MIFGLSGQQPFDAGLDPLRDNGGPTHTHALLPGSPAIDAGMPAVLVTPNGVSSKFVDTFSADHLIDGSGLNGTPTGANFDSLTHAAASDMTAWVTGSTGNDDYFDSGAMPELTFDLGGLQSISDIIVWGYYFDSPNNNEAKTFEVAFSTDGGSTFSDPVTINHQRTAANSETLSLGGSFMADHVRLTFTDNHFGTAGAGGGNRVGLGEVRFLSGDFSTDQRGQPRFVDGDGNGVRRNDIGAVEVGFDFGDAWEVLYPTLLADDGPRHLISDLFLGPSVDGESDGQPIFDATGDDNDASGDDEDGVIRAANIAFEFGRAMTSSFLVYASEAGMLDAWIDFDGSGTFQHPDDHLGGGTSIPLVAGENIVSFSVSGSTFASPASARFRISDTGNLLPTGFATGGEVEDHQFHLEGALAFGSLPLRIQLPRGTTKVLADGGDIVVRQGEIEMFRGTGSRLASIEFVGTDGDDIVELGDLSSAINVATVPIRGDGMGGFDTLRLTGAGQQLPLIDLPDGVFQNIERIDVRGSGANSLSLTPAKVAAATDDNDTLQILADLDDTVEIGDGWTLGTPGFFAPDFSKFFRVVTDSVTGSTLRLHGPAHWQNPIFPEDVTGDGQVISEDVMVLINAINDGQENPLPEPSFDLPPDYIDPTGDNLLTPLDVITVINYINKNIILPIAEPEAFQTKPTEGVPHVAGNQAASVTHGIATVNEVQHPQLRQNAAPQSARLTSRLRETQPLRLPESKFTRSRSTLIDQELLELLARDAMRPIDELRDPQSLLPNSTAFPR